jgi:hypothetical protein
VPKTLTRESLTGFNGTDTWYRHALVPGVTYTEGVRHVAETGEAYWLIDEIATAQLVQAVRREEFQHWRLKVDDNTAKLTCDDGNGRIVYSKGITFTDFPLPEIAFFYANQVIMLPGEY